MTKHKPFPEKMKVKKPLWKKAQEYRSGNIPHISYPQMLPILNRKSDIIDCMSRHQVFVLAGETGCGKTTQLPKLCLEAGRGIKGKIGCTQPRRIAATSIATFIQSEVEIIHLDKPPVTCQVRYYSTDHAYARIKFMTDGILLAELEKDLLLRQYDTLIIDEVHERSLNIDILLGYIKRLLPQRPDLKLILSSATIQIDAFSKFFNDAPIIEITGRTYPVTTIYDPITDDVESEGRDSPLINKVRQSVMELLTEPDPGDILIFMPTEADIRQVVKKIQAQVDPQKVEVLPLFSRLSLDQQSRIFKPSVLPKIIVSTNIAETSVTVPGIKYVIDSGLARISRYCPKSKIRKLPIEAVSRSSANQRKGRCGRVSEGVCIRLYTEEEYIEREMYTPPEIIRSDLAGVILLMLSLPIGEIDAFPFMNPPPKQALKDAFRTLEILEAVDKNQQITALGRKLARFPTDPRLAKILLCAKEKNVLPEALVIIAALAIQDPFTRPLDQESAANQQQAKFKDSRSDFLTYLNLWSALQELATAPQQPSLNKFCRMHFLSLPRILEWRNLIEDLLQRLGELQLDIKWHHLRKIGQEKHRYEPIHQAILSGFLANIAMQDKRKPYLYLGAQQVNTYIFPGSSLFNRPPEWVCCAYKMETSKLYSRTVAKIRPEWIEEHAHHLVKKTYDNIKWHQASGSVRALESISLWRLPIVKNRKVHFGRIDREKAREILIEHAIINGESENIGFIAVNQTRMEALAYLECKIRDHSLLHSPAELFNLYHQRLPDVVDIFELKKWLRANPKDTRLYFSTTDILKPDAPNVCEKEFPDTVYLGSTPIKTTYIFDYDSPHDGVSFHIPQNILHQVPESIFEWLIPGWRKDLIYHLLKNLPKQIRSSLGIVLTLAEKMAKEPQAFDRSPKAYIAAYIKLEFGESIFPLDWPPESLPRFLTPTYLVENELNQPLARGRSISALKIRFPNQTPWKKINHPWIKNNISDWDFEQIPAHIEISHQKGDFPHWAYPCLRLENDLINRTFCTQKNPAFEETQAATSLLFETTLYEAMYRFENKMSSLSNEIKREYKKLGWSTDLLTDSIFTIKQSLIASYLPVDDLKSFQKAKESIPDQLDRIAEKWEQLLHTISADNKETEQTLKRFWSKESSDRKRAILKGIKQELEDYLPPDFIRQRTLQYIEQLPRYLKMLKIKTQKAMLKPDLLDEKENQIRQFGQHLAANQAICKFFLGKQLLEEYRLWIEELKVSLFAQELKTLTRISPQRLQKKLEEIELFLKTHPTGQ